MRSRLKIHTRIKIGCRFLTVLWLMMGVQATGGAEIDTISTTANYQDLAEAPWRVQLLPGQAVFTFTMYGCPGELSALKAMVETMQREGLGNGFDPGPAVGPGSRGLYQYLSEVGWPVVGYAQTADHQVKDGLCHLSDEQERILRMLAEANIFAATQLGEWGYYFHNLSHQESWWRDVYGDRFDEFRARMKPKGLAGYDVSPSNRRECYAILEDYFRTRQEAMRGWNLSVTGHSHYEAYAGQWGARVIGLEVGENIAFTQSKLAFARGAARRNSKPWSVQVSQWFAGSSTSSGPLQILSDGTARGLDAGHSLSFFRRMWHHAWFAGSAMVTPEASSSIFFESDQSPYELTSHGHAAATFYQFTRKHDRGIPYTPVAVVIDKYCGYNAYMGKPWGILEPTAGDLQLHDLLQEQLFPAADHIHRQPFPENPEASYLRPTPFGEIIDVQLSDAPTAVLSSYPVLLLAGDHEFDESFVTRLSETLARGSRLLISTDHESALTTSQLAALREKGTVEVLEPWSNPATGRAAAISNARLMQLSLELLPVAVEGDPVLYQINRIRDGWVIELINNDGILKFPTTPTVVDGRATATVQLTPRDTQLVVQDWTTGVQLARPGQPVLVEVESGGLRYLALRSVTK